MGCEVFAGFQPALEEWPPLGCDRADLPLPLQTSHRLWRGGFLLFGTTLAKWTLHKRWTLHKLCTLVQSKLSICELSYLTLRMKTSKRGGGDFN